MQLSVVGGSDVSEGRVLSKCRLMCLSLSGHAHSIRSSFPDAEVIRSVEDLERLKDLNEGDQPDAVIFFAEEINDGFYRRLRYAREILLEYSVPLIIVSDHLDVETKKRVLKSGADDCFTSAIHPERFAFWIDFVKRFKRFSREQTLPQIEQVDYRISRAKRLFDMSTALFALILASPLLVLVAIMIKLESRGPIFYVSKRAGSGYKIFDFLKFRTMRIGADAELSKLKHLNQYNETGDNSVFFKIKDDPRITRIGTFLRNTSLDELPQLINVLRGDMSIVGNRPLPLYEAQQLTKEQCAMRFMTAAGITGLWQVTKRGRKELSQDERIALDVQYAKNNSFQKDLLLICRTLPALTQQVAV